MVVAEIGRTPRPTIEKGSSLCEIGWGHCPRGMLTTNRTSRPPEFVYKEVVNEKMADLKPVYTGVTLLAMAVKPATNWPVDCVHLRGAIPRKHRG